MKRLAMLVATIGVLLLPGAAFADSSCQQYNTCGSSSTQTQTISSSQTGVASTTATRGTLPFTGIDVVLLLAGGGTLLGAGLVVRRLSRGTEH